MIESAQIAPVKYTPGTSLDSLNTLDYCKLPKLTLGNRIVIPEGLRKLYTFERCKQVVIHRCFLVLGKQYFPIFAKHYDLNEAQVLLYVPGIQAIISQLSPHHQYVHSAFPRYMANVLIDLVTRDEPYMNYDANDRVALLNMSNSEPNLLITDDVPTYSHLFGPNLPTYLNEMQDFFSDWSTSGIDVISYIDDLLYATNFTTNYVPVDPYTQLCLAEPCQSSSELRQASRIIPRNCLRHVGEYRSKLPVQMITEFNADFLRFCTWLHQLPLQECAFTLKFLRAESDDKHILHSSIDVLISAGGHPLYKSQPNLLQPASALLAPLIKPTCTEVTIVKNLTDDVWFQLHYQDQEPENWYMDLAMASLLSQNLISTTEE